MIRLVQGEGEKRRLLALCEKTPFGCKIASIANSYGFDKSFANFWLNTEEDVVYCLVDGAMLLSGTVLQGTPPGSSSTWWAPGRCSAPCATPRP